VVLAALGISVAARADMMPAQGPQVGPGRMAQVLPSSAFPRANIFACWDRLGGVNPGSRCGTALPEEQTRIEPTSEIPRFHVLADRQNGAGLCLCALLSLGLCKAAPWMKRLSWGTIPDWYHDGGPYQIGHSLAVSPDCLCPGLICRFLPPPDLGTDPAPDHGGPGLVSLWRKSQFVPAVRAPRGPPGPARGLWLPDGQRPTLVRSPAVARGHGATT